MQIKLLVSAAAIALVAGLGSATGGDRTTVFFDAVGAVGTELMTEGQLGDAFGKGLIPFNRSETGTSIATFKSNGHAISGLSVRDGGIGVRVDDLILDNPSP